MTEATVDYGRWAEIVIDRWQLRIQALGIVDTGELFRSFHAQVIRDANGNAAKIAFTFHFYGWYVAAGTGRGYSKGNGGDLAFLGKPGKHRKPRDWYNKIYWAELNRLVRMVAQRYGEKAAEEIRQLETEYRNG